LRCSDFFCPIVLFAVHPTPGGRTNTVLPPNISKKTFAPRPQRLTRTFTLPPQQNHASPLTFFAPLRVSALRLRPEPARPPAHPGRPRPARRRRSPRLHRLQPSRLRRRSHPRRPVAPGFIPGAGAPSRPPGDFAPYPPSAAIHRSPPAPPRPSVLLGVERVRARGRPAGSRQDPGGYQPRAEECRLESADRRPAPPRWRAAPGSPNDSTWAPWRRRAPTSTTQFIGHPDPVRIPVTRFGGKPPTAWRRRFVRTTLVKGSCQCEASV